MTDYGVSYDADHENPKERTITTELRSAEHERDDQVSDGGTERGDYDTDEKITYLQLLNSGEDDQLPGEKKETDCQTGDEIEAKRQVERTVLNLKSSSERCRALDNERGE
jgi:hypothetical protein